MPTLISDRAWVWGASQFGGGYHAPGALKTQDFYLLPPSNGYFVIHASLTRVGGGGEAVIGITRFTDMNGTLVTAANETAWAPIAWTRSGSFTVAALARGAAMVGSVRIQAWQS